MRYRNLFATGAVTAALLLGPMAGLAAAHVTITSPGATQGDEGVITFRVPTEKDVATTKVVVVMPTDTPLTDVLVSPKAGWNYSLTMAAPAKPLTNEEGNPVTQIVSRVTWTATGGGIKPDEFDQFDILADPLPAAKQLTFKALQTYADGSVVSWIQEPVAGAPEPDFPAPVLTLADPDSTAQSAASPPSSSDVGAVVLAAGALAVSLIALAGVCALLVRSRRRPAASDVPGSRMTVGAR